MEVIEDELGDILRIMKFKEKCLSQAESAKKYSMCEHLTVEMKELKDKKRVPELEKQVFVKKARRAKQRQVKLNRNDSESSDVDADGPSSSRSEKSRSTTPASSQPQLQFRSLSSPSPDIVSIQQHTYSCTGQSPLLLFGGFSNQSNEL